jgi:hypothetical protein
MYKYHYTNINSGASVYSHVELHRPYLTLRKIFETTNQVKVTHYTGAMTKPVIYEKPKVYRKKRV